MDAHSRQPGLLYLTPSFRLEEQGVRELALIITRPRPTRQQIQSALHGVLQRGWRSLTCTNLSGGVDGLP